MIVASFLGNLGNSKQKLPLGALGSFQRQFFVRCHKHRLISFGSCFFWYLFAIIGKDASSVLGSVILVNTTIPIVEVFFLFMSLPKNIYIST